MKTYKELNDEELEKITGGEEKTESEYIEEMIADLQTIIYLSPATIAQLKKAGLVNVWSLCFRCSYWQNSPELFNMFVSGCKEFGNIDYTGCYVLK